MTIKTHALRIVLTPPAMVAGVYAIVRGYWWIYDKPVDVNGVLLGALALSLVLGLFLGATSPREITWDDDTCTILSRFGRSGTYRWDELEGWSPYQAKGMHLLKFQNEMTYQIPAIVLPEKEWKAFQDFLEKNCSDKKVLVWINLTPWRKKR